jgi:hypothetical protein
MIDFFQPLTLRAGAGGDYENGLCVMEAVAWMASEGATDEPECACPILGAFAFRLNDSLTEENRQQLKPLILPLTGTRSKDHEKARAEYLVLAVTNRIVSQVFEARWPNHAKALREAKTMYETADAANAAADAIARAKVDDYASKVLAGFDATAANAATDTAYYLAADTAYYLAADTAYYLANAAYLAANAADAALTAADAVAAYDAAKFLRHFDANAATAVAADARQQILLRCIPILQEAINLGPNGADQWPTYEPRAKALGEFAKTLERT